MSRLNLNFAQPIVAIQSLFYSVFSEENTLKHGPNLRKVVEGDNSGHRDDIRAGCGRCGYENQDDEADGKDGRGKSRLILCLHWNFKIT